MWGGTFWYSFEWEIAGLVTSEKMRLVGEFVQFFEQFFLANTGGARMTIRTASLFTFSGTPYIWSKGVLAQSQPLVFLFNLFQEYRNALFSGELNRDLWALVGCDRNRSQWCTVVWVRSVCGCGRVNQIQTKAPEAERVGTCGKRATNVKAN